MSKHDKLSVFISLILRHKPETIGITLDEFGYANVADLIKGMNDVSRNIDFNILQKIVKEDNKGRYSFDNTVILIRANQGHSVNVKVPMREVEPPEFLYHGTSKDTLDKVIVEGIKKMKRLYVHLSQDIETALQVGNRHGEAVVLRISANRMYREGHKFYLSENNVWQTDFVPYDRIIETISWWR